jgi:hypothetical protein
VLSDATAQPPTITDRSLTSNDSAVTHLFSRTVTNDDLATSPADTVTITTTAPPDEEAPVFTPPVVDFGATTIEPAVAQQFR